MLHSVNRFLGMFLVNEILVVGLPDDVEDWTGGLEGLVDGFGEGLLVGTSVGRVVGLFEGYSLDPFVGPAIDDVLGVVNGLVDLN